MRHDIGIRQASVTEHPPLPSSDRGFDAHAQLRRLTDRRIRLSRAYEQKIHRAGAGEAAALSMDDLREAAAEGPVVVLNVSTLRCDALVIRDSGPRAIPLPELTYSDARFAATRYRESLLATQAASTAFFDARELAKEGGWEAAQRFLNAGDQLQHARREQEQVLTETLQWLWEAIVEPVKPHLALPSRDGACLPRIWWCPTGPLLGLPMHVAETRSGSSAESILEWAVSSYVPTISALLSARRSAARRPPHTGTDTFLLLALSDTPGELPLPHVAAEAESIFSRLPSADVTVLDNEHATKQRVQHALTAHRSAHLGCHAEQDLTDPSNGALVLYDGRLTVLELGQLRLDGDFAYLSACKTATGGVALAEESVSMAAALLFAGIHRVIATLWSVQDTAAAQVAELAYSRMVNDGRFNPNSSAVALHSAVAYVRGRNPDLPSRWSPFIHIGI